MNKKLRNICMCGGILLLSIFTGCKNFLNGSDILTELENAIEYTNAPTFTVLIASTDGSGSFLTGNGEKNLKVGDSVEVEFKVSDAWQFQKWIAVDKDNQTKRLSNYVLFSNPKETKTKITILEEYDNLLIKPLCEKRQNVTDYSPKMEENGVSNNKDIVVSFANYLDETCFYFSNSELPNDDNITLLKTKSNGSEEKIYGFVQDGNTIFKNISITDGDGTSINAYFGNIKIISGKTLLIERNDSAFNFESSATKTIHVQLSKDIKDYNGVYVPETGISFSYKINASKVYDSTPQTIKVISKLDEGTVKSGESIDCFVGEKYPLRFEANNKYKFSHWEVFYNDGTNDSADDIISVEDRYNPETTFSLNYNIPNIAIKAVCIPLLSIVSVTPKNLSTGVIRNTNIEIVFSETIQNITDAECFNLRNKEKCIFEIVSDENADLTSYFNDPEIRFDKKSIIITANINKMLPSQQNVLVTLHTDSIFSESGTCLKDYEGNSYSLSFTTGSVIENTPPIIQTLTIAKTEQIIKAQLEDKYFVLPKDQNSKVDVKNHSGKSFAGFIKVSDNTWAKTLYIEEKMETDIYGNVVPNQKGIITKIELPKNSNGISTLNFTYTFENNNQDGLYSVKFYVEDDYPETTKKQSDVITYYLIKDTNCNLDNPPKIGNSGGDFYNWDDSVAVKYIGNGTSTCPIYHYTLTSNYQQDDDGNRQYYKYGAYSTIKRAFMDFTLKAELNDIWYNDGTNVFNSELPKSSASIFYGKTKETCTNQLECKYDSANDEYSFSTYSNTVDGIPYSIFETTEGYSTENDIYLKFVVCDEVNNEYVYYRVIPGKIKYISRETSYNPVKKYDFSYTNNNYPIKKCRFLLRSNEEASKMIIDNCDIILHYRTCSKSYRYAADGWENWTNETYFRRVILAGSYSFYFQPCFGDENYPNDSTCDIYGDFAVSMNDVSPTYPKVSEEHIFENGVYKVKVSYDNVDEKYTNLIEWIINGVSEYMPITDYENKYVEREFSADCVYEIEVKVYSSTNFFTHTKSTGKFLIGMDNDNLPPYITTQMDTYSDFTTVDDSIFYNIKLPLEDSHFNLYKTTPENIEQKFYYSENEKIQQDSFVNSPYITINTQNVDNKTCYYSFPISELNALSTYYLYGDILDTYGNTYSGYLYTKLAVQPMILNVSYDVSNRKVKYEISKTEASVGKEKKLIFHNYDSTTKTWASDISSITDNKKEDEIDINEKTDTFIKVTGYTTDNTYSSVIPAHFIYTSSAEIPENSCPLKTIYLTNNNCTVFRTQNTACPALVTIYSSKYDYKQDVDLWKIAGIEKTIDVITDSASYMPSTDIVPSGNYYIYVVSFADGQEIYSDVILQK